MIPISSAAPRLVASPGVRTVGGSEEVRSASTPSEAARKPLQDEYVPEERKESCGRYWLGKDENGSPKIYFDDPEAKEASPASPASPGAEPDGEEEPQEAGKAGQAGKNRKAETCTGSTDAVDREIKKLKEKKEKLERQLSSETDETKIKDLERKLSQVESELRQKDNDAYRRQHATFTEGG